MNLEHAQPDRAARPQSTRQADTYLHGGWLILARVAWGAVVVLVLLLFLVSLPTYLTYLQTVCASTRFRCWASPSRAMQCSR